MPVRAVLVDLLMATMDSMSAWAAAAGDREAGLAWRDAVTARMIDAGAYVPYEGIVADAALELGLRADATERLAHTWAEMRPWPDTAALRRSGPPFGFVTNCSTALAELAVRRSGLSPALVLSAEEAGWYKPRPEIYRLACERMGTPPVETRFVAGAPYDARGASAAGLRVTLVARRPANEPPSPEISVVASLDEALAAY